MQTDYCTPRITKPSTRRNEINWLCESPLANRNVEYVSVRIDEMDASTPLSRIWRSGLLRPSTDPRRKRRWTTRRGERATLASHTSSRSPKGTGFSPLLLSEESHSKGREGEPPWGTPDEAAASSQEDLRGPPTDRYKPTRDGPELTVYRKPAGQVATEGKPSGDCGSWGAGGVLS